MRVKVDVPLSSQLVVVSYCWILLIEGVKREFIFIFYWQ